MFIYILLQLETLNALRLGELTCNLFLEENSCNKSGYCIWRSWKNSQRCVGLQCHLVDEIEACRHEQLAFRCSVTPYIPPQFVESCYNNDLGLKGYYYRFQSDLTGDQISDTSNLVSQLINDEISISNMYQLYNLDVLYRKNEELQSILDLYIKFKQLLIGEYSHPYYLERLIYETLQNIRDDQQITLKLRQITMEKILQLIDIYYERLNTFSTFHYTTYNFINFNHLKLNYFSLQFSTLASFTWNDYPENGYFQLTAISLEIFGLQSPASPVFIVRISSRQLLSYKFIWTQTTSNQVKLMQIDLITLEKFDTFIQPSCSNGHCEAQLQGPGNYIFIQTSISDDCTAINPREVCHQALCLYDYDTFTCENF